MNTTAQFVEDQIDNLVSLGLDPKDAEVIAREAGASLVVRAVSWILDIRDEWLKDSEKIKSYREQVLDDDDASKSDEQIVYNLLINVLDDVVGYKNLGKEATQAHLEESGILMPSESYTDSRKMIWGARRALIFLAYPGSDDDF